MSTTHKFTYKHYVCYPDDGKRHEIIDGDHYMNPAPSTFHQDVSRHIQFQLYVQVELTGRGKVFSAPVDVEITPHDIVQPDLVLVMNDRRIILPAKIKGVPNLIVEILSPSSEKNDRGLKFSLYEKTGVDEYWIVDPIEREIEQYVLVEGSYQLTKHEGSAVCQCQCLDPPAIVDFAKVW